MKNIKSFLGMPLSKNHVLLSKDKALDRNTGMVVPVEKIAKIPTPDLIVQAPAREIKREVEVVEGIDKIKVELDLFLTETGEISSRDGFLIEVFESGSDGKLTRLYRNDVVDPLSEDVVREGFEHYLTLEVDK